MDALWRVLLRFAELTGAKQKGKMLVIIESPDPVATRRLQHVCQLDFAHKNHVPLEHLVYRRFQILLIEHAQLVQAKQERYKVQLVACAVVDSF